MKHFDLDTPLIQLSNPKEALFWTARNAVEGVQIFGGIGSGKTSGSGRKLALKYLSAGFGGLVLTAKPDEKELWQEYCRLTNRTDDLIIVEPSQKNYFNFLEYESHDGKAITENIVQVLKTVIQASAEKSNGRGDDSFWENALDMLIYNVIDLCQLAYGKVSVQLMFDIVQTLPREGANKADEDTNAFEKAYDLARAKIQTQTDAWKNAQPAEVLRAHIENHTYDDALCDAIPDVRTLKYADQFFWETLMNLHEKTRSIIDFSFTGFLHRLLRDPVYTLFCNNASTFTPEDCLNGKIILINLPVKTYHKAGQDAQIMFKYMWQRAMEKRNVRDNGMPVFLWADEAQNFLHEHDADYQATARSSRIATVYISQNMPNYISNMGGMKSDSRVKSFLGTLATKIFHANADMDTNRYASDLIGDGYFEDTSGSTTAAGQFSSTQSKSLRIDKIIRPEDFTGLRTGGPQNGFIVQGIMHLQGHHPNHVKIRFNQT